jgi:hypothetical protein
MGTDVSEEPVPSILRPKKDNLSASLVRLRFGYFDYLKALCHVFPKYCKSSKVL